MGVSDCLVDLIGDGVDCVICGGEFVDILLVVWCVVNFDYVMCVSLVYLVVCGVLVWLVDL